MDLVLLDMNFGTGKQGGGEGLFWLDRILELKNPPAVILITAFGDIQTLTHVLKRRAESDESEISFVAESLVSHPCTLEDMERQFIAEVLKEKKGNLTLVAQQLDISRQTLYNKMRKYGL